MIRSRQWLILEWQISLNYYAAKLEMHFHFATEKAISRLM